GFAPEIAVADNALTMRAPERFALRIQVPSGEITPAREWIENFDLRLERERGLFDRDHHLCVGRAEMTLTPGIWHGIVASVGPDASPDIAAALARRQAHDRRAVERAVTADPVFAK